MGKAPLNYVAEALQTKSDKFHGQLVSLSYLHALATGITQRINELDRVKKALFYGKAPEGMQFISEGVESCERLPYYLVDHNRGEGVDLIHGIIGKVTEAGELLEALMHCMNGAPMDLTNLLEEVGDGQWYDAIICASLGTSFDQVQQTNIAKLRARFPDKFTEYDANNRDLSVERQILEQGESAADLSKRLYETTDAAVWAAEFMKVYNSKFRVQVGELLDEGWMISWFANAIEIAKSHERRRIETAANEAESDIITLKEGDVITRMNRRHGGVEVTVDGVVRMRTGWFFDGRHGA